ncbi:MAG: hypothetical protein NTZ93_03260 [Candidatus Beckwithbacteria bacterium]|nr:hypothetical protein [Candidatus Beckwithbacteria bacterium]
MSVERRALLLAGPQHYDEKRPAVGKIRKYLEHLDPLGIAIVSSYLKAAGFKTTYAQMSPKGSSALEGLIENVGNVFISARHFDTSMAKEATRIAKLKGKRVIVGGYSPTFSPESFAEADVRVKGEFEPVAEEFMTDLLSGRLKDEYDSRKMEPFDMKDYVYPDRSIFSKLPGVLEKLRRHPQEWQRGCTNYCSFCSPTRMQRGGDDEVRYRSAEDIIKEIKQMGLGKGDHLFSTDLNTSAIPREVLYELFTYLNKTGIHWYTEGTVAPLLEDLENFGPDKSLLRLMSAKYGGGGCFSFLYGADDIVTPRVAGSKDKEVTLLAKAEVVFKEMGIPLNLSVVVGLDNHSFPDTFYRHAYILKSLKVPYTFLHLATPYPSTPWGIQMERQGRIKDRDTLHYNHRISVFEPKNMTSDQLQQGYYWLMRTLYTPKEITNTFRNNFDSKMAATNLMLAIIKSGLPWGVETYLSTIELEARGYMDNKIQRDLDAGYKNWLSQSHF